MKPLKNFCLMQIVMVRLMIILSQVMRKADMPGTSAEPKQSSGKPPQPFYPQSLKKGTFQRQYSSSHLQWRRDQPANGETSSTAA